jgi:hypothetical protein
LRTAASLLNSASVPGTHGPMKRCSGAGAAATVQAGITPVSARYQFAVDIFPRG